MPTSSLSHRCAALALASVPVLSNDRESKPHMIQPLRPIRTCVDSREPGIRLREGRRRTAI